MFYWNACTKSGKRMVMYICVLGVLVLPISTIIDRILNFVPTVVFFIFHFFMTMAANQYIYVPTNCIIKCFHSFFAEMIKIHESILHVSSQIWHTFCQGLTIWCTVCRQREKCYLKNDWKTEIPHSVSSSSLLIIVHVRTFFIDDLTWSFGWFFFKPELKLGFIWSDILGILLNFDRWVKQIQNIDGRCKAKKTQRFKIQKG